MKKSVSIIIPVYNEEDNIEVIVKVLQEEVSKLDYTCIIIFVDDGSDHNTLQNVRLQSLLSSNIYFISLTKNFGYQNALTGGLNFSKSDCVITIDGDMPHPPSLIPELLKKWEEGYEIVYTIRNDNNKEITKLKRKTSRLFHNILNSLSGIKLEPGIADFRLLDKKAVGILCGFGEDDLFWRGLVKWIGFKQASVEYIPEIRKYGKSKYTYGKMMGFGLKGIIRLVQPLLILPSTLGLSWSFCLSSTFLMFSTPYILNMLF